MTELAGRKVVVVGLAASGFAAAKVLLEEGAEVTVTESSSTPEAEERAGTLRSVGAMVETGGHTLDPIEADLAVVSPGIPPTAEVIRKLDEVGIPVVSEVEVASWLTDSDLLAVTGTNGKTTTTSLLASMLEKGGIASVAAGNIGLPLIEAIRNVPADGAIAVEVSSFQLAFIDRFHARVAVLLNVAEDHMDWHGGLGPYAAAKARIFENQSNDDAAVINLDDPIVMGLAASAPGRQVTFSSTATDPNASIRDGFLSWQGDPVVAVADLQLKGRAGWEDSLAAMAAALSYGIEIAAVRDALLDFRPLGHRMQRIETIDGVTFIDDSKATNPHATLAAVAGLRDVILIAGGRSKGIDLSALTSTVPPVTGVVAIGEATEEVLAVFGDVVPVAAAATMDEAVKLASDMSVPGGSVLLSPGCASLDMYSSYAERGEAFARAVTDLGGKGRRDGD